MRGFFYMKTPGSRPAVVQRPILIGEFEIPRNFRDIAGDITDKGPVSHITTIDGKRVLPGIAYRSSHLSSLSDEVSMRLITADISDVVDLRSSLERSTRPDHLPAGIRYHVADVLGPYYGIKLDNDHLHRVNPSVIDVIEMMVDGRLQAAVLPNGSIKQGTLDMRDLYAAMTVYVGAKNAFHKLFLTLAYSQGAVTFHCTAGKDRTGFAAALLLRILGVSLEIISKDFMASNYYIGKSDAVKAPWLQSAWDTIDSVYGNFDTYVSEGLRLTEADIIALRKRFLALSRQSGSL